MPVEPVGATPRTTRSVPNKTVSSNLNALVKTRTSPQKQFQNPPGPTKLLPQTNPPTPSLHHHELLRSVTAYSTARAVQTYEHNLLELYEFGRPYHAGLSSAPGHKGNP